MATRGDDLEDDFIDEGFVAGSDDEETEFAPLEGEEDQFVADDDVLYSPETESGTGTGNSGRRTTTATPSTSAASASKSATSTSTDEAKRDKKRKKRAKDNERKAKKQRLTLVPDTAPATSSSTITASQSPATIAALLKRGQKQVLSTLTEVELEDIAIPESCIQDTSKWTGERTHETLAAFIKESVPTLATRIGQTSKNNGAPTCIVLAGNANRVTDLTRALRPLKSEKGGEICKLFARHFKLAEHAEHLKRTKVGVAVGTPGRISDLLNDTDSLILKALSHIVLDVTFIDSKLRSMLDTLETKQDIFKKFFTNKVLLERLRNGKCTIVLF